MKVRNFFFPPHGTSRRLLILPYSVLALLTLSLLVGGAYVWEYTNSPPFCGTTCHTMPPEYAAYQVSPHARVACVECHIGREFIGNQMFRKAGDLKHVFAVTFNTYEFPIYAKSMRPAPQICEKCHSPEKFSDDSLRVRAHYSDDAENSFYNIYLILKTGGGSKRIGLGRGIHWHVENEVQYFATDKLDQTIPYIRVLNDDGSYDEFVDVEADFDLTTLDATSLKTMDCITCHNRISHTIFNPEQSVDNAIARGVISPDIPYIRRLAVDVLRKDYSSQEQALESITDLDQYYEDNFPEFYATGQRKVLDAVEEIQKIYNVSVYQEQEIDWNTHPNNVGHTNSPGCFRCHDGKHLNGNDEAIRLECNLCHSIPVVAQQQDFLAEIEISRGPEPDSHFNPNWIALHNEAFGPSCAACHTMDDPGGVSNTSFCSNSACHGSVYTYAGFDAPALREVLKNQLPPPEPAAETSGVPTLTGAPTYDNYIGPLFESKCSACHGDLKSGGLNLLTYETLMYGGADGAVILPGVSADSILFQVQSAGTHFAKLTSDELEIVKQWIDAGAPEK